MFMNIQALVFDLDGTAIPMQLDGMPSKRVIEVVKKAQKLCHVSIATGRSYKATKAIMHALNIDDLCILDGGASLYSCKTNQFVWKQAMDPLLLQQVIFKVKKLGDYEVDDDREVPRESLLTYHPNIPLCLSCIYAVSKEEAQEIVEIVKETSGLVAHAMGSWTIGKYDVHITHELATKKHALQALLSRLNVDHKHVMVVGDGGNDLPLFELAGLKVAMGNAADELKKAADWIAPSVDEDGLAIAIEKYIFHDTMS